MATEEQVRMLWLRMAAMEEAIIRLGGFINLSQEAEPQWYESPRQRDAYSAEDPDARAAALPEAHAPAFRGQEPRENTPNSVHSCVESPPLTHIQPVRQSSAVPQLPQPPQPQPAAFQQVQHLEEGPAHARPEDVVPAATGLVVRGDSFGRLAFSESTSPSAPALLVPPPLQAAPPRLAPKPLSWEIMRFVESSDAALQRQSHARQLAYEMLARRICDAWPFAEVVVYGSMRTGLCTPNSDIDIAVLNAPAAPAVKLIQANTVGPRLHTTAATLSSPLAASPPSHFLLPPSQLVPDV
eukprot:4406106-Pleurochrysis_carterae.AAC.1